VGSLFIASLLVSKSIFV